MCTPQAGGIAQGVVGVTTAFVNYFAIQSAHHAAVQAANLNYHAKAEQVERENVQLSEQQGQNNLSTAVQQAQAFGRIATSAGALGLGAYSSHQMFSADAAAYNRTLGITDKNYANKRTNLQAELEGAGVQRNVDISNAPHTNLGMLALGVAQGAVGGMNTYASMGGRYGVTPVGGGKTAYSGDGNGEF